MLRWRIGQVHRVVGSDRPGYAFLDARTFHARGGGVIRTGLPAGKGDKSLERGKLARGGHIAEPLGASAGQLRAQVSRSESRDGVPAFQTGFVDQPRRRRAIGAHRMRRAPAILREEAIPLFEHVGAGHVETSASGTTSARSASSSGIPAGVIPIRLPLNHSRPCR